MMTAFFEPEDPWKGIAILLCGVLIAWVCGFFAGVAVTV